MHFSRKVAGFLRSAGVRPRLFLRRESAHAERAQGPRPGRDPSAGWGRAAGSQRRAPRGHLAASPPLLHSSCPSRCRAGSHPLPQPPLSGGRPLPFARIGGLQARVPPRGRPLHLTSLAGTPFPFLETALPKAGKCEQIVCEGGFTTCTEIIFDGGEQTAS